MAIRGTVGLGQQNATSDVLEVQKLLNAWAKASLVSETGKMDQSTISALAGFQEKELDLRPPSGRIEPNSPTWVALSRYGNGQSQSSTVETALIAFEADAAAFAGRFIQDANIRANYLREAQRFSADIRSQVARGILAPAQGAERAVAMRNAILEAARIQSSDVGRALAQAEKAAGVSFEKLLERYATRLFRLPFSELSAAQQDQVFQEIIRASGRPNPRFTALARNLGRVGKGLFVVSLAFATYQIVESDRPGREIVRQGVGIGAGIGGSIAGGALAGLACGPGAPVCVGVGALVGGIAFAVGVDVTFTWLWQ
jgi:hypothetical protein